MSDEATAFDDDHSLDLFWHALNYRTASTEHADGCWLELEKCVGRMVAQSRLAALAHAEGKCRAQFDFMKADPYNPSYLEGWEDAVNECADAIRREREG